MDPHPLYRNARGSSASGEHDRDAAERPRQDPTPRGRSIGSSGIRRQDGRLVSTRLAVDESHPTRWSPLDIRSLEYISDSDPNLTCLICRTPFVAPVILSECDHCFCQECLEVAWNVPHGSLQRSSGRCPTCRTRTGVSGAGAVSRILTNMLDDLAVKCPEHEQGCLHTMKRSEVQDHIDHYCDFTYITCLGEDCNLPAKRKEAGDCIHIDVSCLGCKKTMRKGRLQSHWEKECPDYEVPCHLCRGAIFSRAVPQHIRDECPAAQISCPGSRLGCPIRQKREDLVVHIGQCIFASLTPYMEAQAKLLERMEEESKKATCKLKVLDTAYKNLEALVRSSDAVTARREIDAQRDQGWWTNPNSMDQQRYEQQSAQGIMGEDQVIEAMPQDLGVDTTTAGTSDPDPTRSPLPHMASASAVTPYTHLLSLHESLGDEVSRVSTALHELEGRHSMMMLNENIRLREEMAYLGGQVGGLGRQVGWLTSTRLQSGSPAGGIMSRAMAPPEAVASAVGGPSVEDGERMRQVGRLARRSTDEGRTKL